MTIYYIDASAWVKRFIQEPGTDWIQRLFAAQPLLACSSLGFIEVLATLSRKHRAGEIAAILYGDAVRNVEHDWQRLIEIRLDVETMAITADVIRQFALRGADAIHLASALLLRQRLGDESGDVVFVAADEELISAARASGFSVLNPAEEERAARLTENDG